MARREELNKNIDVRRAVDRLNQVMETNPEPKEHTAQSEDMIRVTKDADGNFVWEIRTESPQERLARLDDRYRRVLQLADQKDTLFENNAVKYDPNQKDPVDILREKKGDFDPHVITLSNIKRAFADFDYGPKGLVPKNSEDAKIFKIATDAVREGRVTLPTVSEYQQQKLKERRKQNMANETKPYQETQPMQEPPHPMPQTPTQSPQPAPATNYQPTPMRDVRLDPGMVSRAAGFDIPEQPAPVQQTQIVQPAAPIPITPPTPEPVPQPVPQPAQPMNITDIQNRLAQTTPQMPPSEETAPPVETPSEQVVFEVPEQKAEAFYDMLPDEDKTKVSRARKINIVETKMVEVPTAVRTITSLDEYRRIVKRKVTGEYVEVPLANSGYIATVRSATSLQLATILPDDIDDPTEIVDYAKRFQFAYDHLVTTSVGPMSYNTFLAQTSMIDLDALIWAIFKASVPEKQEITIVCGNQNCRNAHPFFYNPSDIVDVDALSVETKMAINEIIAARDVAGDAKTVHDKAPAVNAKVFKITDDMYVYLKSPDAQMIIERAPLTETIVSRYSEAIYFTLLLVKQIQKGIRVTEDQTDPTWFNITDPILIAEELINMPDEDMETLLAAAQEISSYDGYTFRIKGPITCPKCGHVDKTIGIELARLIFFKVGQLGKRD